MSELAISGNGKHGAEITIILKWSRGKPGGRGL